MAERVSEARAAMTGGLPVEYVELVVFRHEWGERVYAQLLHVEQQDGEPRVHKLDEVDIGPFSWTSEVGGLVAAFLNEVSTMLAWPRS